MDNHSYWRKQTVESPLFADIEWAKPERRDQAGKLGIVGGTTLGFSGVATGYSSALEAGAGQVRVFLPDTLRKSIPTTLTDTLFGPATPSGSLARDALPALQALGQWADGILLIGDAGRNSETALLYDDFIASYSGPLTITRDAIDLVKNNASLLVERPSTLIVGSFSQVQKLFQAVYYPKILTFSMNLTQLVEALHAFTITYPSALVVFHRETLLVAADGQVVTQTWNDPMRIWRGVTAARAASYWLWNPGRPLESSVASIASKQ